MIYLIRKIPAYINAKRGAKGKAATKRVTNPY